MRNCPTCGIPLQQNNLKFCPNCGTDLSAAASQSGSTTHPIATILDPGEQMKKGMSYSAPLGLDKKTFFKKYSLGNKECVAAAIIGYICAGTTAIFAVTGINPNFNMYSLVDVGILLALSLLVHLLRSRIASVALLVYTIASMMVMIINVGVFGGWLGVAAGASAVVGSFQCVKEWKAYQARSQQSIPQSDIPRL
ncbi:MAG: zinc ribbon domain-containing protein [Christensenella sp.]|nr:zinc ribbon domain-containing protein [Christensenella sp.]